MTDTTYRIVAGYDYSPSADLALEKAFDLASKEAEGEVHVVSVVVQMGEFVGTGITGVAPSPALPLDDAYDSLEARIGERLSRWQERTRQTFSRLAVHIRSEVPATEIAQLASDLEADLIVVGTHGRRGLRRLLLGSVAEGVVRLAHCPVLVVRPKMREVEAPQVAPPCPKCVQARKISQGKQLWCERHEQHHGQRLIPADESPGPRASNPPLVTNER